ncbi:MAG: polysaccharide biosynthesis C-terminal domain-containing protein [Tannerella sp.]|jgi:O-antigen/teichoic acid export membrane protein|nr:polysaccharide biosynthesis C-terminal domain-containing protein [Tannerella sp.]
MLKKVLETIAIRYVVAALNLALIFINGKALGIHGMGVAGVIYASANIIFLFNSIFCGNTIVYHMNRYPLRYVIWPAYVWAFAGSAIACGAMALTGLLPAGFGAEVYGLATLLSLVGIHSRVLLGKDRIKAFNATFMIQGGTLFFSLLYVYYVAGKQDVEGFLWGVYLSNVLAWLVSLLLLYPPGVRRAKKTQPAGLPPFFRLLKKMVAYGLWSSADNLTEGLTTRLNYFLLQRLSGYGQVGLLDAGTRISESVWHINRSISSISYSQVARTSDPEMQRQQTLRFFKWTYGALILVIGMILLIPERIYTDYLFTAEFRGIRKVIGGLSVGIVMYGANNILSHYFIGTGKVKYSVACSCVGLLALLLSGSFLVPAQGVVGSAVSTSIAFSAMLLFSLTVFVRHTHTSLRELLPSGKFLCIPLCLLRRTLCKKKATQRDTEKRNDS